MRRGTLAHAEPTDHAAVIRPAGLARRRSPRYRGCVPLAFHHLAVQVRDLEGCERFYREVLGLPVLRRWPDRSGRDRSVWLGVEGGFLALERTGTGPEPRPFRDGRPGLHLVALRIPASERAAWEARLAALGIPVADRTRWTLYLQDPEDNRIGLSHHPDEAP